VLRFWETRFGQIRPMKRGGGRRYYRPQDVELLRGIRTLLYGEGYTIKGVQRILKEQGPRFVVAAGRGEAPVLEAMPEPAPDEVVEAPAMVSRPAAAPARVPEPPGRGTPDTLVRPSGRARSGDETALLQATLAELLECKRILDQAR
jgi:DNA-binding transcriptional MerR regulator